MKSYSAFLKCFSLSFKKVVLDNTALNRIATERLKKATPTLADVKNKTPVRPIHRPMNHEINTANTGKLKNNIF